MRIVDSLGRTIADVDAAGAEAACEQRWRYDYPHYAKGATVFWEPDPVGNLLMRYRYTVGTRATGRKTWERTCEYQLKSDDLHYLRFKGRDYGLNVSGNPVHEAVARLISLWQKKDEEVNGAWIHRAATQDLSTTYYLQGEAEGLATAIVQLLYANKLT